MKLHTNLSMSDVFDAARIAHADVVDIDQVGSRCRDHGFVVTLEGDSKRRPNSGQRGAGGRSGAGTGYAATWDQWGVFFAVLFDRDPQMIAGSSPKSAAYDGRLDFHNKTGDRFTPTAADPGKADDEMGVTFWPADAHGDHTFRFMDGAQRCTKCSAVDRRWS